MEANNLDIQLELGEDGQALYYDAQSGSLHFGSWSETEEGVIVTFDSAMYDFEMTSDGKDALQTWWAAEPFVRTKGLDIPAYHRACKPLGVVLKRVQRRFDLPAGQIALVGDQIYTDVLGGNRAGMITILVDPIDCKETALFKFKRRMEMPVIQRKKREDAHK